MSLDHYFNNKQQRILLIKLNIEQTVYIHSKQKKINKNVDFSMLYYNHSEVLFMPVRVNPE